MSIKFIANWHISYAFPSGTMGTKSKYSVTNWGWIGETLSHFSEKIDKTVSYFWDCQLKNLFQTLVWVLLIVFWWASCHIQPDSHRFAPPPRCVCLSPNRFESLWYWWFDRYSCVQSAVALWWYCKSHFCFLLSHSYTLHSVMWYIGFIIQWKYQNTKSTPPVSKKPFGTPPYRPVCLRLSPLRRPYHR